MRRIVIVLTAISYFLFSSYPGIKLYDMEGNKVRLTNGKNHLIILYSPACCHDCMNYLAYFCGNKAFEDKTIDCAVLMDGSDIMRMHLETSYIQQYIEGYPNINTYYDSCHNKKKRVFNRFNVEPFPALLIIDEERKQYFFSYEDLFVQKDGFQRVEHLLQSCIAIHE